MKRLKLEAVPALSALMSQQEMMEKDYAVILGSLLLLISIYINLY